MPMVSIAVSRNLCKCLTSQPALKPRREQVPALCHTTGVGVARGQATAGSAGATCLSNLHLPALSPAHAKGRGVGVERGCGCGVKLGRWGGGCGLP